MAATVNILSGAQANPADGGTAAFSSSVGGAGTLARDTSTAILGGSSLRFAPDGSGGFQFVTAQIAQSGGQPWHANTTYTASWYIKGDSASVGKTLRYFVDSSGGAISGTSGVVTLTTSWQRISVTFTTAGSITFSWAGPRLDTGSSAHALNCWLACLQVNPGQLAPWVPGGGAQTLPYSTYIGGQPVDSQAGNLSVQNQIGQRSTGSIQVKTPLGVAWQYGTQVQVYDPNGNLVYAGYTTKTKVTKVGARQGTGYLEHTPQMMDNCYRADKRVIFRSYLLASAGSIAQDLVNRVLYQEGVTYTSTSIAAGATIPAVIWNGKRISDALTFLATTSGYWWNIDVNGVLWFQPYGGRPAPFILDGTQVESGTAGGLTVTYGNDMYVNTQYLKGGYGEHGTKKAPLDEVFHGNGVTRSFTLSYQVSTIYQVLLNGADVTAKSLTKGSGGGYFYYAPSDAVIAQDPSQPVLGSGDTLEVLYAGRVPAIGKAVNNGLIAAQQAREGIGSGIVESVYADTKVHTLSNALQIASALLSHFGSDATLLEFDIRASQAAGLMEGQMLTVTLSDFAGLTNKQMLVTSVAISDQLDGYNIWYHVAAVGSPLEAAQWQTFFQNLMNQQSDPSDLSDVNDQVVTPVVTSTLTHAPSFSVSGTTAVTPICGTVGGPHTMVCGNWVCS